MEDKMANAQRKKVRNSFPSCVVEKKLLSDPAQTLYRRSYDITAEALFRLSFNVTIFAEDEKAKQLEDLVNSNIDTVATSIKEERARIQKLMKDNGVSGDVDFPSPSIVKVKITSPAAGKLLGVISEFDALMGDITNLWLHGVLDNKQYTRGFYALRQQINKMMGRLRQFWFDARKEMNDKVEEIGADAIVEETESKSPAPLKIAAKSA